jgi:hypothetical protein
LRKTFAQIASKRNCFISTITAAVPVNSNVASSVVPAFAGHGSQPTETNARKVLELRHRPQLHYTAHGMIA